MDSSKLIIQPYRISTMVVTGSFGTPVQLQTLFQQMASLLIPIGYPAEGILKMEHEKEVIGYSAKDVLTHRHVSTKTFFNQATLVIRQIYKDAWKEANLKVFANGGFQMTGVPTEEFARKTLLWLLDNLKNNLKTPIWKSEPKIQELNTQLLNSDYSVNATILRTKLHKLLTRNYNLFSTYESTIYQGVNTKYYYNEGRKPDQAAGICHCQGRCDGKGSGKGEGQCKKITISAFQTGSIIITGARFLKQINEAYVYFNEILKQHCPEILQPIETEAS
jgi:TATA-box binding protein (TBP) (component of TFIID and TFIIIB)